MSIKAFELSSVIQKVTVGDRIRIQIESIEYCGKSLYVGTYDSFVIEFKCDLNNSTKHVSQQQSIYRYLGLKKPVIIIKAIFILERILCVCDSNLIILNQDDLEMVSYGNKLKNVNTLCLNENPSNSNPFSVQLCIARRKQLFIYNLTSEKMIAIKEISIGEPGLSLSMDGQYICVGTDSQFQIVNWETNQIQDLCASDSEIAIPISKRITKEEFLISGPSSLGLFVKTTGISDKPPLQWGSDILAIAYSHPYILCLSDRSLSIFSVVDQQLKQLIPFNGGTYLENFDGNILISSNDSVFALRAVAWDKQVQCLLAQRQVKEALDLTHNWHEAGVDRDNFNKCIIKIKQEAGFVQLSQMNFIEAKKLFIDGNLDVLQLIHLYPNLLPQYLTSNRSVQHYIDDISHLTKDNSEDLVQYKLFLIEYLQELISNKSDQYQNREIEINTALVTLYSEFKIYSENLLKLLSDRDLKMDSEWIVKHLELNKHFHALALFYSLNKETFDKAIDIWTKIETNVYSDELYDGLSCIARFLSSIDDELIILNNIDFVLERDQRLGASVLINREDNNKLNADIITKHLQKYPEAEQIYLEYLVLHLKIEKEKFHTHLAVIYVENLIKLIKSNGFECQTVKELREKLQYLLRESSLYRVQLILGKAIEAKLYYECAILYGKLGEHQKTLSIFVEQLKDYKLAEKYCVELYSNENDLKQRYKLFHTLLGIYLDLSLRNVSNLVTPALELLNNEVTEFDTIKVLEIIPQNWSISIIEQFLNKGIRRSMNRLRQSLISKGLVTTENRIVKHHKLMTERKCIFVNEDRVCSVCRNSISEPEFIWFPTFQIVLHPHCAKGLTHNSNKLC